MIRYLTLTALLAFMAACGKPLPQEEADAINERWQRTGGLWPAADAVVENLDTRRPINSGRVKRVWGCHTQSALNEGMRYWVRTGRYPRSVRDCGYESLDLFHGSAVDLGYRDYAPYAVQILGYRVDEGDGRWYSPGNFFYTGYLPE